MKTFRKVILILLIIILGLQIPVSANSETDSAIKLPEKPATHIQLNTSRMVAYIASDPSGFSIIDIKNDGNTVPIAHIDLPESETVSYMRLYDSYIYLCTEKSLYVINVSDSTDPILTANIPIMTDETLTGFEIDSDRLYLFDRNRIHVYSTVNQAMPSFLRAFSVVDPLNENGITDIAVRNGIVYIASGYDGVQILDFTDINHVIWKSRLEDIQGFCSNVNFAGRLSFINIIGENAVGVLDISDIMNPGLTGVIQDIFCERSVYEIETLGSTILLPDDSNKIHLIDTSDLKNIKQTGWIDTEGIPAYIRVKEYSIYIFDTNGEMSMRKIADFQPVESGEPVESAEPVESVESGESNPEAVPEDSKDDKSNATLKDSDQKTAYITIDDGPSKNNTPKNLDTLKKYDIKATFFVLPHDNMEDIYKRIIEEGHVIGNHGYVHDYESLYNSFDYFKKDITKARDFIYKKIGYSSTVYRFPGGSMGHKKEIISKRVDLLSELGYRYFDWDVSTADTDPNLSKYGTEEQIVNLLANNVIKGAKNKKKLIILMHDSAGKTYSAKALPKIIEGLQKQGYVFDVLTNY